MHVHAGGGGILNPKPYNLKPKTSTLIQETLKLALESEEEGSSRERGGR
jgi:hypothetical protein